MFGTGFTGCTAGITGLTGCTAGVTGFTGCTAGVTGFTGCTEGVTGFTGLTKEIQNVISCCCTSLFNSSDWRLMDIVYLKLNFLQNSICPSSLTRNRH